MSDDRQQDMSLIDLDETVEMENSDDDDISKIYKKGAVIYSSDDEQDRETQEGLTKTPRVREQNENSGRRAREDEEEEVRDMIMNTPRHGKRLSKEMNREEEGGSSSKRSRRGNLMNLGDSSEEARFKLKASEAKELIVPKRFPKGKWMSQVSGILLSAHYFPPETLHENLHCSKFIGSLYTFGDSQGQLQYPLMITGIGEGADRLQHFVAGECIYVERADFWDKNLEVGAETKIARAPKLLEINPLRYKPLEPLPLDRVHAYHEAMYHPTSFILTFDSSTERDGASGLYKILKFRTADYKIMEVRTYGDSRLRLNPKRDQAIHLQNLRQKEPWTMYKFHFIYDGRSRNTPVNKDKLKKLDTPSTKCDYFDQMEEGKIYDIKIIVYGGSSYNKGNTEFAAADFRGKDHPGTRSSAVIVSISGDFEFDDGEVLVLNKFHYQTSQDRLSHRMVGSGKDIVTEGKDEEMAEYIVRDGLNFI